MKTIYISHPYTGDEAMNRDKAHLIAARLAKEYPELVFLNPLDAMCHAVTAGLGYGTVLRQTVELLRRCNSVIMTGNWRESRGCMAEYLAAQDIGMRIYDGLEDFRRNAGVDAGKDGHDGKCA